MAKSVTLNYITPSNAAEAIEAGDVVIRTKNDEGEVLGFAVVTQWLADRPKVLIAKLISNTGDAQIETFEIVTKEMIADVKPEPKIKQSKVKTEKVVRKVKPASGIEADVSTEQGLVAKYGDRIIPGTVRFETDGIHAGKRTVEIRCYKLTCLEEKGSACGFDWSDKFSGETRRVATSDLFQVMGSAADHAEKRKAGRRLAAKMRKISI
jgi:hypothetical protein